MHKLAMPAAIIANEAEVCGKFKWACNWMMVHDLSVSNLASLRAAIHFKVAPHRLLDIGYRDARLVKAEAVYATPTYIVYNRITHKALRIDSLSYLGDAIELLSSKR